MGLAWKQQNHMKIYVNDHEEASDHEYSVFFSFFGGWFVSIICFPFCLVFFV